MRNIMKLALALVLTGSFAVLILAASLAIGGGPFLRVTYAVALADISMTSGKEIAFVDTIGQFAKMNNLEIRRSETVEARVNIALERADMTVFRVLSAGAQNKFQVAMYWSERNELWKMAWNVSYPVDSGDDHSGATSRLEER